MTENQYGDYPSSQPDPFSNVQIDSWPGFNRLAYFTVGAIASFLAILFAKVVGGVIGTVVVLVALCVLVYCGIARLHNLGNFGWWFLFAFIPLVNAILNTYLFAFPPEYAQHRQMDATAKMLIG